VSAPARFFVLGSPLPPVPPRPEGGHTYRREYAWQERCPDYQALLSEMHELYPRDVARRRAAGLPVFDEEVASSEALKLIRPYLPHIKTPAQLFQATAWQPFKVIFKRGWVGYTNFGLVLWAQARAAGKPAPWERKEERAAA
jgi:hypothetical protein